LLTHELNKEEEALFVGKNETQFWELQGNRTTIELSLLTHEKTKKRKLLLYERMKHT